MAQAVVGGSEVAQPRADTIDEAIDNFHTAVKQPDPEIKSSSLESLAQAEVDLVNGVEDDVTQFKTNGDDTAVASLESEPQPTSAETKLIPASTPSPRPVDIPTPESPETGGGTMDEIDLS